MMKLQINPLVAKDLKSIKDYTARGVDADKALETIQEIYSQLEYTAVSLHWCRLV